MTRLLLITCAALCLPLSACTTPAPPAQTQPATVTVRAAQCPLTPCLLPARPVLRLNEDWRLALDATEDALLSCAAQVQDCIQRQQVGQAKVKP